MYTNPQDLFGRRTAFDGLSAQADGWVLASEYAVTDGGGQGNLVGALAEAGFALGMERNGQAVLGGSYAPLFVNDNARWERVACSCASACMLPGQEVHLFSASGTGPPSLHDACRLPRLTHPPSFCCPPLSSPNPRPWPTNLIVLDNHRWFGIPSYHVQHLLAAHLGVARLEAVVAGEPADSLTAGASCLNDACDQVRAGAGWRGGVWCQHDVVWRQRRQVRTCAHHTAAGALFLPAAGGPEAGQLLSRPPPRGPLPGGAAPRRQPGRLRRAAHAVLGAPAGRELVRGACQGGFGGLAGLAGRSPLALCLQAAWRQPGRDGSCLRSCTGLHCHVPAPQVAPRTSTLDGLAQRSSLTLPPWSLTILKLRILPPAAASSA